MKHQSVTELISLKNKTAMITGTANGIGNAIARRFAESGADLLLVDKDTAGLELLKKELSEFKINTTVHTVDLSDKSAVDSLWKSIDGSKVDILINNAGIYPFKKFLDLDESYLDKVMQINLFSVLWMCQHFIKCRIKKGGVIVNTGSIEAIMPFKADLTHYSVSKVGVLALTRDLVRDFGKKGFRVNAVVPGGVITKGTKSAAKKAIATLDFSTIKDSYNFLQRLPSGRFGSPDDIAKMILVLSSDISSYVYGAIIPVDGGFLSA